MKNRSICELMWLVILLWGVMVVPARAEGVAELSLDKAAVRSLLVAATRKPLSVEVAGWGAVTLQIEPPATVQFVTGGVEADLVVLLVQQEISLGLHVRYEPQVDARHGTVSLAAVEAIPDSPLPLDIDLAPLLPAADLPRRLAWNLDGPAGDSIPIQALVQGVVIGDERLVVQLGLSSRAMPEPRP